MISLILLGPRCVNQQTLKIESSGGGFVLRAEKTIARLRNRVALVNENKHFVGDWFCNCIRHL